MRRRSLPPQHGSNHHASCGGSESTNNSTTSGRGLSGSSGSIPGGVTGGKKVYQEPQSSASWWNPIDLAARLIYTGDAFANDSDYAAAQAGAGDSYNENKAAAHGALDNLAAIDPTPLSDGLNGGLHALEGDTQAAKAALAQAAMGPVGDALRLVRGANRGLGFADDIARNVGKHADEAADVAKKVDMPPPVVTRVKGGENAYTKAGREAHQNYNPGTNYNTKYRSPTGKRPDAVDFEGKIVRELKPNNPAAIRRGWRQVERYRQELQELFGGVWESAVDTYERWF